MAARSPDPQLAFRHSTADRARFEGTLRVPNLREADEADQFSCVGDEDSPDSAALHLQPDLVHVVFWAAQQGIGRHDGPDGFAIEIEAPVARAQHDIAIGDNADGHHSTVTNAHDTDAFAGHRFDCRANRIGRTDGDEELIHDFFGPHDDPQCIFLSAKGAASCVPAGMARVLLFSRCGPFIHFSIEHPLRFAPFGRAFGARKGGNMNKFQSKKAIWWSVGLFLLVAGVFFSAVFLPNMGKPYGSDAPDVDLPSMRNVPDRPIDVDLRGE